MEVEMDLENWKFVRHWEVPAVVEGTEAWWQVVQVEVVEIP